MRNLGRTFLVLATFVVLASACSGASKTADSPKADPQSSWASRLPQVLKAPLANDAMEVTIHRLSNGLTVYISENNDAPRVTSWIAVRVGSRHESPGSTGLAHYLEHMMFKGSSRLGTISFKQEKAHLDRIHELYDELRGTRGEARNKLLSAIDAETQKAAAYAVPNEFDQLYAELGITGVNAFTGEDMTVYIADVPTNRFEDWAVVEGERFTDPQFRLFYPELEAVYEEKNRSLDSPRERVHDKLMAQLFPGHPYGTQTTIGSIEHLKTPAYSDMAAFYDTWYRPNNTAILLAGDVNAATVLPILEKAFSRWKPKMVPEGPGEVQASASPTTDAILAKGENSISIGWRTVPVGHPDEAAIEVMDLMVDNSETGLLNVDLVMSQKLPAASAGGESRADGGYWSMRGTAREGQTHDIVRELLLGVVAKLKAGSFTEADLKAAVLNKEISEKQRLETNDGRVSKMATSYLYGRPWADIVAYPAKVRAVTKADVTRVATHHLSGAPAIVVRKRGSYTPPRIDKPSITPVQLDTTRESGLAKQIRARTARSIEAKWLVDGESYHSGSLSGGRYLHVANTKSDLFSLTFDFGDGSRSYPKLCESFEIAELSAPKGTTTEQLKRALYALGSSVAFICDTDYARIDISGIDSHFDESLQLVHRWLADIEISDVALKAYVSNTLSRRKDMVEDPRALAYAIGQYAGRGKESPALNQTSNAELKAMTANEVATRVRGVWNLGHHVLYFGPKSFDAVALVANLGVNHTDVRHTRPRKLRRPSIGNRELFYIGAPVNQSQISMWFPGAASTLSRPWSKLLSEYLGGGMGGLIFQEVREARGLAYSAGAYHSLDLPKGDSALIARIGTQTDKTLEAMKVMLTLVPKVPVDPKRFQIAKTSTVRDLKAQYIAPRDTAATVLAWRSQGLLGDPRKDDLTAISEATVEAFRAAIGRIDSAPRLFGIVTNPKRVTAKSLEGFGKVNTVTAKDVFSF